MLTSIQLKNYRRHDDTTVPLSRFTLLAGANGVGKSSVLQAAHLHGQALSEKFLPGKVLTGPRAVEWLRGRAKDQPTTIRMNLHGDAWTEVEFRAAREGHLIWSTGPGGSNGDVPLDGDARPPKALRGAQSSVHLQFDAKRLAEASESDDEVPRIESDGYGLATALKELKATDTPRFEQFERAVNEVLPGITGIRFERVKARVTRTRTVRLDEGSAVEVPAVEERIRDQLQFQERGSARLLPAFAMSEGTLLVVGLLAFMHLGKRPRLVLMDDIDRGLHPKAQAELVGVLQRLMASDEGKDLQIIATTHSPYLVDAVPAEQVVVLSENNGRVQARRLADHPDRKLLGTLRSGEFLASTGKEWFGL